MWDVGAHRNLNAAVHLSASGPSARAVEPLALRAAEPLALSQTFAREPIAQVQRSFASRGVVEAWVQRYEPPSLALEGVGSERGRVTYLGRVTVNIVQLAEALTPTPWTSPPDAHLLASRSIESGDSVRVSWSIFETIDTTEAGHLLWNDGQIRDFVVAVFRRHELPVPVEADVYKLYVAFDADKHACLDACECISLADVLMRAVLLRHSLRLDSISTVSSITQRARLMSKDCSETRFPDMMEICLADRLKAQLAAKFRRHLHRVFASWSVSSRESRNQGDWVSVLEAAQNQASFAESRADVLQRELELALTKLREVEGHSKGLEQAQRMLTLEKARLVAAETKALALQRDLEIASGKVQDLEAHSTSVERSQRADSGRMLALQHELEITSSKLQESLAHTTYIERTQRADSAKIIALQNELEVALGKLQETQGHAMCIERAQRSESAMLCSLQSDLDAALSKLAESEMQVERAQRADMVKMGSLQHDLEMSLAKLTDMEERVAAGDRAQRASVAKVSALQQELDSTLATLQKAEARCQALEQTTAKLYESEKRVRELEDTHFASDSLMKTQMVAMEGRAHSLQVELQGALAKLADSEERVSFLEEGYRTYEVSTQAKASAIEAHTHALHQELGRAMTSLSHSEESLRNMNTELGASEARALEYREGLQSTLAKLHDKDSQCKALEVELATLQRELQARDESELRRARRRIDTGAALGVAAVLRRAIALWRRGLLDAQRSEAVRLQSSNRYLSAVMQDQVRNGLTPELAVLKSFVLSAWRSCAAHTLLAQAADKRLQMERLAWEDQLARSETGQKQSAEYHQLWRHRCVQVMSKGSNPSLLQRAFALWRFHAREARFVKVKEHLEVSCTWIMQLQNEKGALEAQLKALYSQVDSITETLQKELKAKEAMAIELRDVYAHTRRPCTSPSVGSQSALSSPATSLTGFRGGLNRLAMGSGSLGTNGTEAPVPRRRETGAANAGVAEVFVWRNAAFKSAVPPPQVPVMVLSNGGGANTMESKDPNSQGARKGDSRRLSFSDDSQEVSQGVDAAVAEKTPPPTGSRSRNGRSPLRERGRSLAEQLMQADISVIRSSRAARLIREADREENCVAAHLAASVEHVEPVEQRATPCRSPEGDGIPCTWDQAAPRILHNELNGVALELGVAG